MILKIKDRDVADKKEALKSFVLICFIGAVVMPVLIGTFYALPAADDFTHANEIREALKYNNPFIAACIKTKETYLTWQGTFVSSFLVNISKPSGIINIISLRVLLFLNVLLLEGGVVWFGTAIVKKVYALYNRNMTLLLLSVFTFISFGMCRGGQEIFYWYTGACVYTVPMSLTFCCLGLYIEYLWGKKTLRAMMRLCILAFLASGGVLQVTAILCYGMLVLWGSYLYTHRNKAGMLSGIPFLISLISALINALAPGNFVRHTSLEDGIHVFKAIKNVLTIATSQIMDIFTENLFLYVIIACFLFGLFIISESVMVARKYHPMLFLIVLLGGFLVSIFPFCLGAGSDGMSWRNIYMCDLYVGWSCAICALEFGSWLGAEKGYRVSREGLMLSIMCMMLIFFKTGDLGQIFQGTSARTFYGLYSKDLQDCSEKWIGILKKIENAEESKVVIQTDKIPETILMAPGLGGDEMNFVNSATAKYYNKDTVKIIFSEEQLYE